MQYRNPIKVFALTFITFGIYFFVWHVRTKNEMNSKGAHIPTAWLLLVPFANYFWLWRFCQGVELVTNKKIDASLAFVTAFLLSFAAPAAIQDGLNEISNQTEPSGAITVSPKSRLLVFLLAYFLAPFGAHRFYLGKYKTGALIIVTISGFFGIWPMIDCAMALCGRMKDKDGLPITKWQSEHS